MAIVMKYIILGQCLLLIKCSATITLSYLRGTYRFGDEDVFDHYLGCRINGRILHWKVDGISVGGFQLNQERNAIFSSQKFFSTRGTLLSLETVENQSLYIFDSVLVVSVTEPDHNLDISCLNEHDVALINTNQDPEYGVEVKEVFMPPGAHILLDYILAAPIINFESYLTHLFLCQIDDRQIQQSLGISGGPVLDLNRRDNQHVESILYNSSRMIHIQAILSNLYLNQTVAFVFINSDVPFNFTCSFGSTKFYLQSRQEFSKGIEEQNPTEPNYMAVYTDGTIVRAGLASKSVQPAACVFIIIVATILGHLLLYHTWDYETPPLKKT